MTALSRKSALSSRHTELGSGLEDWNDMGTAWTYNSDPNDEHDAVRESAGLFDMSPLKKVFLRGPDAAKVVDHVITRDMTDHHSPWEVGLGFTVSRDKKAFRGKEAVFALEGKERFLAAGISVDHDEALIGGEVLSINAEKVGVVNSPAWSHRLNKSIALVHLHPDAVTPGTRLEVTSDDFSGTASVESIPFYDPLKSRVHA